MVRVKNYEAMYKFVKVMPRSVDYFFSGHGEDNAAPHHDI